MDGLWEHDHAGVGRRDRLILWLGCVLVANGVAAEFRITDLRWTVDSRIRVEVSTVPDAYFRLLGGSTLDDLGTVEALGFAGPLESFPVEGNQRFYRVQRVDLAASLDSDGDGIPDVYELEHPWLDGLDATDAGEDPDGDGRSFLDEYLETVGGTPFTTVHTSPADGEHGVSVNREFIVFFSRPLAADTLLTTERLYAEFSGRRMLSRVELSGDRRKATLFPLEPLPGGTRVQVVLEGAGLRDDLGREIDADNDGTAGGLRVVRFDTLSLVPVAGTAMEGRVLASDRRVAAGEPDPPDPVPLEGVTITVDGAEEMLRATTDAAGYFRLEPCPAGRFFVHIDGRTAVGSDWPGGDYYPSVGKAWEAWGGVSNNLAGGTGVIYLPLVRAGSLQPVSATRATVITFPGEVLSEHPELTGVEITVPANALFSDDGIRGGRVGIAPVAPDRLPEPLPGGLEFPLVITIQTDGPLNFDEPVPVRFPNLPDPGTGEALPAGAKSALWSFNHDTGVWEIVGPMTVSDDGRYVVTDPGVGVLQPGWHGTQPGVGATGGDLMGGGCASHGGSVGGGGGVGGEEFRRRVALATLHARHGAGRDCQPRPGWDPSQHFNGCGPDQRDYLVPDNPNLLFPCATFYDACKRHDISYSTCGKSKAEADHEFLEDLLNACNCIPLVPGAQEACRVNALAYYTAVSLGGDGAYEDAQDAACDCDPPPECRDRPSGGPSPSPAGLSRPRASRHGAVQVQTGTRPPPGPLVRKEGPHRYAVYNLATGEVVQRGKAGAAGIAFSQLILAPHTTYDLLLLEEATLEEGFIRITTGASGTRLELPPIYVKKPTSWDFDGDGLHDGGELTMGTDMLNPDTDGDGINDATEVQQGTNPLGQQPGVTGVIASQPADGEAQDVVALNHYALVAGGDGGLTVFSAFAGANPVRLGRLVLPGPAQRVGWDGGFAAVACRTAGLVSVNLGEPAAPKIHRHVNVGGDVLAVAVGGVVAYAGLTGGEVTAVDLESGVILDRLPMGGPVHDLVVAGNRLYVATVSELIVGTLAGEGMRVLGRIGGPDRQPEGITGSRRLAVGEGVAYVTSFPGYDTFDVSDPTTLKRLGVAVDGGPNSFKQIVPNGSGAGLAAVGVNPRNDGTHDVWLYDLDDASVTTDLVTQFATPGMTRAVTLYRGLAYAADGTEGLQVISYLAPDTQGVPPTITLETPFREGLAEEGQLFTATAVVRDDVQVSHFEFFVDGVPVRLDGTFPFELRFIAPLRSRQSSFLLEAVATDSGGNRTVSEPIELTLVPDATPPRVVRTQPSGGAIQGPTSTLQAFFNEPLDPDSLNGASVRLRWAGPDGAFGTTDDADIALLDRRYHGDLLAVFVTLETPLEPGVYRWHLSAPLADLAGNALAESFTAAFRIFGPQDSDADGVPDDLELVLGTNPWHPDSDGDGVPDGAEDPDQDGLSNAGEVLLGRDPLNPDTDGNGILDGQEDSDGDTLADGVEIGLGTNPLAFDSDGDGWPDEGEVTGGSDPNNPLSVPRSLTVAAPTARLWVPSPAGLSHGGVGTTMARPPVRILAPTFDPGTLALRSPVLARPPLRLMRPSSEGLPDTPGTILSRPPTTLLLLRPPDAGADEPGTVLAQPPVQVLLPSAGGTSDPPGATLAYPPVFIEIIEPVDPNNL